MESKAPHSKRPAKLKKRIESDDDLDEQKDGDDEEVSVYFVMYFYSGFEKV